MKYVLGSHSLLPLSISQVSRIMSTILVVRIVVRNPLPCMAIASRHPLSHPQRFRRSGFGELVLNRLQLR
jgi:hypothetical protein